MTLTHQQWSLSVIFTTMRFTMNLSLTTKSPLQQKCAHSTGQQHTNTLPSNARNHISCINLKSISAMLPVTPWRSILDTHTCGIKQAEAVPSLKTLHVAKRWGRLTYALSELSGGFPNKANYMKLFVVPPPPLQKKPNITQPTTLLGWKANDSVIIKGTFKSLRQP